ncbi:hypothetical protein Pd630_LPD13109 (plasmid) [Rhodococcus opacus PD630]|nr:hypothetical protein Pd630_LPD13109 [Rhodococcus opacus PD630]
MWHPFATKAVSFGCPAPLSNRRLGTHGMWLAVDIIGAR